MTAVVTDFFRVILYNSLDKVVPLDPNINLLHSGKSVRWVYFQHHTTFTSSQDSRYTGIKTVSELSGMPGWSAPLLPYSASQSVGTTTVSDTTYVVANNKFVMGAGPPTWEPSTVSAAALVLIGTYDGTVDPIIYITDTPFEGQMLRQGDGLIARPVSALSGNRSILAWPVWFTGQTTVLPYEGSVAVLMSAPSFEPAYTHHAWLYPQRVNMIANPSFEGDPGTNHWRSNGTVSKVEATADLPAAPGGGHWYGKVAGAGPLAMESNVFPLHHYASVKDLWTIQVMVRGTGTLRIGLLGWEPDYSNTYVDWGDEEWELPASGWLHVYALRRSAENAWGMVRLECSDGEMHVDNVLCEPDWLKGWRYFDGESTYGSRDDYSWYGGENRKGKSYSMWYNHRRAVIGRLFAWDIPTDDFTVTDEEIESQGFVYRWVPAGVRVVPHLDVLWPEDYGEEVPDNAGTPISVIPL